MGRPGRASLRSITLVALVLSVAVAVFFWFVPGDWEGSTPIKAIFGDDLLAPGLLYYLVILAAPVFDVVAIALTLLRLTKASRALNLIVNIVALAVAASPVVYILYTGP